MPEQATQGFEARTMNVVGYRQQSSSGARAAGVIAVVLVSAVAAALLLASHLGSEPSPATSAEKGAVQVTRTAGLLVLPKLDVTVTDQQFVEGLARGIRRLPDAPTVCMGGASYGTTYTLKFTAPHEAAWTAVVQVFGCDEVTLSSGFIGQATSSTLWSELAAALGISVSEVKPLPCGGPGLAQGASCYAERQP
jgi:hypothetical protein